MSHRAYSRVPQCSSTRRISSATNAARSGDGCARSTSRAPGSIPYKTSERVRSGCVAANIEHTKHPSSEPSNATCSDPTAFITVRTSSASSSRGGRSCGEKRSDSPVPRRSTTIKRENDASRTKNFA